jgi:hypothetical protein
MAAKKCDTARIFVRHRAPAWCTIDEAEVDALHFFRKLIIVIISYAKGHEKVQKHRRQNHINLCFFRFKSIS